MRTLQNFRGLHSSGRDIYPNGLTFPNITVDCSADPDFYINGYSVPRQITGISNVFDLQVSSLIKSKTNLSLWYKLSANNFSAPSSDIPPSSGGYTQVTADTFIISGITNSYWIGFGVDTTDYSVLESTGVTLYSSSVSPGLTLSAFTATSTGLCPL